MNVIGLDNASALSLSELRDAVLSGDPGCLCDPELFTGPAGVEEADEPPQERAARIAVAREICAGCPVRLWCLAYALRLRPTAGVWAGLTVAELAELANEQNRSRRQRRVVAMLPVPASGPGPDASTGSAA